MHTCYCKLARIALTSERILFNREEGNLFLSSASSLPGMDSSPKCGVVIPPPQLLSAFESLTCCLIVDGGGLGEMLYLTLVDLYVFYRGGECIHSIEGI